MKQILAGKLLNRQGSILIWVLLLATLALLIGSGSARLLTQREKMTKAHIALLRASNNAENGLEWARARWLAALWDDEALSTPTLGSWSSADGVDRAEIRLTRQSDGTWNVRSEGVFDEAKRRVDAQLPSLECGIRSSLAVPGSLSGNGIIRLATTPSQNHLINTAMLSGISLLSWQGESLMRRSETRPFRLRNPDKFNPEKLLNDYIVEHDGDEPLVLHTLPSIPQRLWPSEPLFDTIACNGYLRIGSDTEKQLILHEKRLIFIADYIEIYGNFELDSQAEIWLIAKKEIHWHTTTRSERFFRGLIWTPGNLTISGERQTIWNISGAIYAENMHLENAELRFEHDPAAFLHELCLPQIMELPSLKNWRILSPEGG